MFQGEIRVISAPELKKSNSDGKKFAVARAVFDASYYDRDLGCNISKPKYFGLVAFDAECDLLMDAGEGERFLVSGNMQQETYTIKNGQRAGQQGTDLKLIVASLARPKPQAVPDAGEEDAGYIRSLTSSAAD